MREVIPYSIFSTDSTDSGLFLDSDSIIEEIKWWVMISNTIEVYWKNFQVENPNYAGVSQPPNYYFCDNKEDADECAELAGKGIKQATSTSLWWFQINNAELPAEGDLAIITSWDGQPKAIIKTTMVQIVKFRDITAEYAYIEGEGDKSLAYWNEVHWVYYTNEMKPYSESPTPEMKIVCEYFETMWPKNL